MNYHHEPLRNDGMEIFTSDMKTGFIGFQDLVLFILSTQNSKLKVCL